ncbi:LuxR C-terminal-related transcriptional regulator [Microbacterium sp. LWH11-1.2]|uniref:LuxR C-terminal-related transcriptional regulator n=1 Tax=Microbacterium sp. LWH11-1.2 TaxID=3135258 RepID=UPI003139C65D
MTVFPHVPVHAVDRPRLRRRLDAALGAPLSTIVAPVGSGKTVLLSQWVESRPDVRFVWLELEAADDDPQHFVARLLEGFRSDPRTRHDLGTPHALSDKALGRPVLEALLAVFREHPGTTVIIDDAHAVSNSALLADIWWLADHLPEENHIVLSSRVDLGFPWSRHRLRHSLLELRQSDLALDDDSAATLLRRIIGSPVSAATLSAVMERTEGWAAGVQLTALGLRNQDDPEGFAQHLRGTDLLIADYLSEQALAQQSPERRDLLLRLSSLDRMSAELIESVLHLDDAAQLLEELQHDSMFLVSLDERREWFRFHHLFRDLLHYRLRARGDGEETRLLISAAEWHLREGDLPSAMAYLLRAREWDRVLDLLLASGRDVFERSRTLSVSRWLDAVPAEVRAERPDAEILRGIVLGMSGDAVRAEDVLRAQSARDDLTAAQSAVVHAYIAARVQFRSEPEIALRAAKTSIAFLRHDPTLRPPDILGLMHPSFLHTLARTSGGRAHFLSGDFVRARRWFDDALAGPGAEYSPYRVHLLGSIALLDAWCGRVSHASSLAQEALELAADAQLLAHPAPADAYLAAALAAVERGEPGSAALNLHEGVVRAESNRRSQLLWIAHLVRTLMDADEPPSALPQGMGRPPAIVDAALRAEDARTLRAQRSSAPLDVPTGRWSPLLVESIAAALTERRPMMARRRLAWTAPDPDAAPRERVERLTLEAWLAASEGGPSAARDLLSEALAVAESHGLVAVFPRMGHEVIRLIAELPGAPTRFRTTVLQRARESHQRRVTSPLLAEQLTDRELEILAHLPSRMTNTELAAQCFVSVNTIKTHTAHIYRKLDVANRNGAVARAQELGIL